MSTRATLTVRDRENGNEAYSIYRHGDGYPDTEHGVFADLTKVLSYAWPLPRFEADDFAAAIIAAWKQPARISGGSIGASGKVWPGYKSQGGNIRMTTGRDAHGDTEYHYELFPDAKGRVVVQCFEATHPDGYGGQTAWKRKGRDRFLTAKQQSPIPAEKIDA